MTADAKVGLLLGLFFIVVIAFLVNGLPNFIRQENPTAEAVTIKTPTQPDMPLDNAVPDVFRLYRDRTARPTAELPQQETVSETRLAQVEIPEIIYAPQIPVGNGNSPAEKPAVANASEVREHVVKSGEILPIVAKMYYGEEEGNRRIVIQKLFEANKKVLKSPDNVRVGDKLIIPSLDGLFNKPNKVTAKAPDSSGTLLDKFSNFLERVGEDDSRSITEYVVQEGDSLWAIAQNHFGDGKRYADILRLNKDKIKNADDVVVGIHLKLPSQ